MGMSTYTMAQTFWILVGLSFLGVFVVLDYGVKSGPSGGAVGAWLLFIPLFFLLGVGGVFQATSSQELRKVCLTTAWMAFLAVAALAVQLLVVEPLKERANAARRVRAASGVDIFPEAAQVEFLKAVRERDVAKVKALLPAVGDLNKLYGKTTLFLFALEHGEQKPIEADLEILEAMLKAGANPNVPPGRPFDTVLRRGASVVKLMLEAGADVNHPTFDGDPSWWVWLYGDYYTDCVKLALAHGADLQARKNGVGAVAMAAEGNSWNSVVMLMEAGAPYKGERAKTEGMLLYDYANAKLNECRRFNTEPEAALVKAVELLAAKD